MKSLGAKPLVLVQGASRGLGLGLARALHGAGASVVATCRTPERAAALRAIPEARVLQLDVEDEESIADASDSFGKIAGDRSLRLLLNVAGHLHDAGGGPEKKLEDVDPARLAKSFRVNSIGPLLVAKHFGRHLPRTERSVVANVSARVGSIGDNRLGGWYGYRASKAAQNMFTRNLSIELGRRHRGAIVVGVHPGTVDTELSAPFTKSGLHVFGVQRAALQLLDVLDGLEARDSGEFFAWDGTKIPW